MAAITSHRSRRLRALLAGGLVLGLGAIVTLAAWNDSEFATGTFAAGSFNLQGSSTDGVSFADHASAPGAALGFVVNPANLAPADSTYAPFAVRLAGNTSSPAVVTVTAGGSGGSLTGLTYRLIESATWGCSAATTGTDLVPAATVLGTVPGSVTFGLTTGSPVSAPGAPVFLCFVVTADSGLVQGQTGTATWEFTAVSQP
ncbi:SipW-cognate class signal peptide [Nakamurella panacisegetis]|uniref:SipW-cognate class signal peptide n=1 Tax=Nakamurella panacisegetis TaxID=1090615 RepID=A0A1H0S4Q9_9ACTN|nr:SipW-dependent-type signal peptide-containing protein [Nakamurella panacisegetis]SDP36615.1 SipW-cognate class signal peptide [Nakamurella panacisegetis]